MFGLTLPEILLLSLVLVVYAGVIAVPAGMICRRIGRPWWFGVFALIPVLNVALLWFVAVTPWEAASASHGAA